MKYNTTTLLFNLTLILGLASISQAQTVNSIFIGKGVANVQTDDTTVTPNNIVTPTNGGAYSFGISVTGPDLGAPTLTLAAGSTHASEYPDAYNLGVLGYNTDDASWQYGDPNYNNWGATSAATIDTLFATGDYTVSSPDFADVTLTLGTALANISNVVSTTPTFSLTGGTWSGGVYLVDPTQQVTITTNAFTGFSSNLDGHIGFYIFNNGPAGAVYEEDRFYSDDNGANNFISYTINPNTLVSGQTYTVEAGFSGVTDLDTTLGTGPTAPLVGAYMEVATSFQLQAVPEPSTYAAIAGALVLGIVMLRRRKLG